MKTFHASIAWTQKEKKNSAKKKHKNEKQNQIEKLHFLLFILLELVRLLLNDTDQHAYIYTVWISQTKIEREIKRKKILWCTLNARQTNKKKKEKRNQAQHKNLPAEKSRTARSQTSALFSLHFYFNETLFVRYRRLSNYCFFVVLLQLLNACRDNTLRFFKFFFLPNPSKFLDTYKIRFATIFVSILFRYTSYHMLESSAKSMIISRFGQQVEWLVYVFTFPFTFP